MFYSARFIIHYEVLHLNQWQKVIFDKTGLPLETGRRHDGHRRRATRCQEKPPQPLPWRRGRRRQPVSCAWFFVNVSSGKFLCKFDVTASKWPKTRTADRRTRAWPASLRGKATSRTFHASTSSCWREGETWACRKPANHKTASTPMCASTLKVCELKWLRAKRGAIFLQVELLKGSLN